LSETDRIQHQRNLFLDPSRSEASDGSKLRQRIAPESEEIGGADKKVSEFFRNLRKSVDSGSGKGLGPNFNRNPPGCQCLGERPATPGTNAIKLFLSK
jgi:hypothetical protein